jgi:hypothetical protein
LPKWRDQRREETPGAARVTTSALRMLADLSDVASPVLGGADLRVRRQDRTEHDRVQLQAESTRDG